jgi:hypothetical protein
LQRSQLTKITTQFTVKISDKISFRLYPDARPNNLEIKELQKGLILLLDGIEITEEGIGFGAPVVIFNDEPYFSTTSETFSGGNHDGCYILIKTFFLNAVSRKQIWSGPYLNRSVYSKFHTSFMNIYIRSKKSRFFLNFLMTLRKRIGISTKFVRVKHRGLVSFVYKIFPNRIVVEVDLSKVDRSKCKEVLFLNEQGSSFFRRYEDTNGLVLIDEQIGGWAKVDAEVCYITNLNKTVGFGLKKIDNAITYRGLERVCGRLSWTGLSYSTKPQDSFSYEIKLYNRNA